MELSIEQVQAEYFNEKVLLLPPVKLSQIHYGNKRYYAEFIETPHGIRPKFYDSVTTMIHSVLPESPFLKEWRDKLGKTEADKVLKLTSIYGSLMHTCFTRLLLDKIFDLDQLYDVVKQYCQVKEVDFDLQWVYNLKQDITSFTQWLIDYEVEPILIEAPLKSDVFEMAGMTDLLCELTIEEKGFFGEVYKTGDKAGQQKETKQKKRVISLIDYKSSRSGSFYLSHSLQLKFYEMFVKENFHSLANANIHLFNWSPKDWRTSPDYNFTEQTGKHTEDVMFAYKVVYDSITPYIGDKNIIDIQGIINLEQIDPLHDLVTKLNFTEYVTRKNTPDKPTDTEVASDNRGIEDRREDTGVILDDSDISGLF